MITALDALQQSVTLHTNPIESAGFRDTLDAHQRAILERSLSRPITSGFIQLQHIPIDSLNPSHPKAAYSIGRSMFETDSLPSHWVSGANTLDELWVPSAFNKATFTDAGVRTPIHVIPGGIDSKAFHPDVAPLRIAGTRGTVFLSVFEWRLRKGWDVLLRAWANAFGPDDDVSLVLRTYPIFRADGRDNNAVINERVDRFLFEHCDRRSRRDVAPIVVMGDRVATTELAALYKSAAAFVLPTRGEGWGRPFMESMACGVPVIATNWSAHLEFMNVDNSYLVDIDGLVPADAIELPTYANQRWANPSAASLIAQMRRVHADRAEARAVGVRARRDMVNEWPWSRAAHLIVERLRAIDGMLDRGVLPTAANNATPGVAIVGESSSRERRATAPSDWVDAAMSVGSDRDMGVAFYPTRIEARPALHHPGALAWRHAGTALERVALTVTVLDASHRTTAPTPPAECAWLIDVGSMVAGGVPPHLVTTLRDQADHVVVPHQAAYDACVAVGVALSRLSVVNPAVDTEQFTPSGGVYRRTAHAATRFLVIGNDLPYRGLQRVLAAYDRTFSCDDDVVLHVLIPAPTDGESAAWRDRMHADAVQGRRHPRAARLWIDLQPIHADEVAPLYRAVDVLIHAGADTGRGDTIREAMACGTPVIATDCAPANNLLSDDCGWLIARGPGGFADQVALQRALRAATDLNDRRRRGERARATAMSWPTVANARTRRIDVLSSCLSQTPRRSADAHLAAPGSAPWLIEGAREVVVLAHADWHSEQAQAIVRAFATACSSADPVSLALCLDPAQGIAATTAIEWVGEALRAAGRTDDDAPDIVLIPDALDDSTLRQLYAAADIVVALRAEAIAAEARAAGCAVLTSLDSRRWQAAVARGAMLAASA
jgi:glycosyltransferase involved in cell wall biosynthesis